MSRINFGLLPTPLTTYHLDYDTPNDLLVEGLIDVHQGSLEEDHKLEMGYY